MDPKARAKGRVCVTGASGFLASWLIKRLLQAGYHVIGTVRDPGNHDKVSHLWELEGAKEQLKLVKADLMEDGSFDEAIMGCEGVFHLASPVVTVKSDPKTEILDPAVRGTLNVLKSCKKNKSLRRVVLTSSSSTVRVRDDIDPNVALDESSWSSIELCERLQVWYAMGKILAEKAAWEFAKANELDMVVVLPTFIIGPSLSPDLCYTALDVLNLLKGETKKFAMHGRMGYVHIDDAARCHIFVYENTNAWGRHLCSSKVLDNDELGTFLAKRYPYLPIPTRFEDFYGGKQSYEYNTSKLRKMGFQFKGLEEMFDDCIGSLKDQGYLKY
ncbi:Tetraketide alpha-pyrone reductase 1 [Acorus calamus]|uniref:Tetraketide alpha-pyrone reductase 1 n=1 Tax=Acorus calamus TaxID=4465 RepID=A0AAV9CG38_ACOCL|nr:Tetraketide alpha-pyrone reductase 1 [Acorus calamus]